MTVKRRYHKTKTGNKVACWSYDFYDQFGKRHQKSGFRSKPKAEDAQAEAREKANSGKSFGCDKNLKFKDMMEKFIDLHGMYLKPSTKRGYEDHFNLHLKDFFGEIKLVDITPMVITHLIKTKMADGLSNKSVNHLLTTLGTAFNWSMRNGYIMYNPVQFVKKLKVEHIEMSFLTKTEIEIVLNYTEENYPDFYPLLLTAIYSGMRRGEILGLTWDCVNFKKSTIKVKQTLHKGKISTPKTKNSIREIKVPTKVIDVLKELKDKSEPNVLNLVFAQSNGKFLDADNMIKRRFNKVLDGAGVARVRFHDLRHTYASLLLEKDLNIKYIQKQMGHASFEITMNTYAHLMPEVYEKSEKAINELI